MTGKRIKLIAVGDIFLGEHPYTLGHGVASTVRSRGGTFLFSRIRKHLQGGDVVCGNLEGIVSPKRTDETGLGSAIFWGEPECAGALRENGFNCLFLANNHTAQHGVDALERTCRLLLQHDIKWTGYNAARPSSPTPAIFTIRGVQVGLLSYCASQQYHLDKEILPRIDLNVIQRDIGALRKTCSVVIISLHWGDEFIDYPSPQQVHLAHQIIDRGAHVILGHHSHTMQGVERYKNGLIAYSLGSFIKDLWQHNLREAAILKCELSVNGVEAYEVVPIKINKQYQPELYSGEGGKRFLRKVEKRFYEMYGKVCSNDPQGAEVRCVRYAQEVKQLSRRDKVDTAMHYLRNLFRYDKELLMKNMLLIAKRRIYRKNI